MLLICIHSFATFLHVLVTALVCCVLLSAGVGSPVIGELDGEHSYDPKKHTLEWRLPVIDSSNKTGSMEFTVAGLASDFFPIRVSFASTKPYCNIEVSDCCCLPTGKPGGAGGTMGVCDHWHPYPEAASHNHPYLQSVLMMRELDALTTLVCILWQWALRKSNVYTAN